MIHISDCKSLPHTWQTDNFLIRKDLLLYIELLEMQRHPFSPVSSMYRLLPLIQNTKITQILLLHDLFNWCKTPECSGMTMVNTWALFSFFYTEQCSIQDIISFTIYLLWQTQAGTGVCPSLCKVSRNCSCTSLRVYLSFALFVYLLIWWS